MPQGDLDPGGTHECIVVSRQRGQTSAMDARETAASVQSLADQVLSEIRQVLGTINTESVQQLANAIMGANRIVLCAGGRMGIVSSAFAMRLVHLGFQSHMFDAPTTPAVGKDDLLIFSSGSGETQTVYDVLVLAKQAGARIALITARPESRMGRLADLIVQFSAPTKSGAAASAPTTIQPMTTMNEQSLLILFDIMVLMLMEATHQTAEDLWRRHRNLE